MNDRRPPSRRLSRLAARALAVGLVVLVGSTAGMSAALAVGNVTLEGYILTDPIPGWGPAPTSEVQNLQSQVSSSLSSETHQQIAVAVEGWSGPDATADILLITLARFTSSTVPPATNLQNSANEVCTGAGEKPGTISAISGIPDSFTEVCHGGTAPVLAADWEQGDIVAFVDASGMSASTLDSVSRAQSAKIPGGGSSGGSSSSSSSALYAGIGVAAVVIGVGIVFMRRRSAARATPAPAGDFFSPNAGPPQWGPGASAPGQAYGAPPAAQGYGAAPPYSAPGQYSPPAGQYAPPAGQYTPPDPYTPPAQPGQWDPGQQAQPYGTPTPGAEQPPAAAYQAGAGSATGAQPPSGAMPGGSSDETVTVGGWQPQQAAEPPAAQPPVAQPPAAEPPAAEPPMAPAAPIAQAPPVAAPSPAPAPVAEPAREVGWHPIEGDVNRQRYWDGSSWTARMRWDGTSWVNESSP